jgi:integrase
MLKTTKGAVAQTAACLSSLGLRVSEVCALQVPHLDLRKAMLAVREGKGAKDRMVPIPRFLVGPLRGWIGAPRYFGQEFKAMFTETEGAEWLPIPHPRPSRNPARRRPPWSAGARNHTI